MTFLAGRFILTTRKRQRRLSIRGQAIAYGEPICGIKRCCEWRMKSFGSPFRFATCRKGTAKSLTSNGMSPSKPNTSFTIRHLGACGTILLDAGRCQRANSNEKAQDPSTSQFKAFSDKARW